MKKTKLPKKVVDCTGCPGLCCRCFPLITSFAQQSISPEQLESHIKTAKKEKRRVGKDYLFAAKNFIYLGDFHKNPLLPCRSDDWYTISKKSFYTCRKLGLDGKCLAYDKRPELCRSYGVTAPADVIGCKLYKDPSEAEEVKGEESLRPGLLSKKKGPAKRK